MKKIFLIAVVLLMMINFIINYHHEATKEQHTPMADFKTKVEMAPMKEYNDPDFGYVVKYPCFFQQEDTSVSGYQGYARFSFTNHANIILESYVTPNYSNTLQACADSLAQKLHSERTMQASNKAFILSGPVYENGVRVDGATVITINSSKAAEYSSSIPSPIPTVTSQPCPDYSNS